MQWLGQGLGQANDTGRSFPALVPGLWLLPLGQPLLGLAQEQGTGNVVRAPEPLNSTLGSSCHRHLGHSDIPRQFLLPGDPRIVTAFPCAIGQEVRRSLRTWILHGHVPALHGPVQTGHHVSVVANISSRRCQHGWSCGGSGWGLIRSGGEGGGSYKDITLSPASSIGGDGHFPGITPSQPMCNVKRN